MPIVGNTEQDESTYTVQTQIQSINVGMLIYAFTTPFVLLVGFVANCLCLIVFRAKRLRSTITGCSCATILTALAAADLLVLFCYIGPEWIQKGLPQLMKLYRNPTSITSYQCKATHCPFTSDNYALLQVLLKPGIYQIYIFTIYVSRMFSVWLLVLFTIERYVGVCYPLRRNLFRNRQKVLQAVWFLLTASIIVCIYKPILSSDSSNPTYVLSTDQHHPYPLSFNQTSLFKHPIDTNMNNFSNNLSKSMVIPDESEMDWAVIRSYTSNNRVKAQKNTRIIFILDSCYAFTLTVVPFLVILCFNIRILIYLLKHDNTWLINGSSSRGFKPNGINNNYNNDLQKNIKSKCTHVRKRYFVRKLRFHKSLNSQCDFPKPHLSFKINTFPRTIHDNNIYLGTSSWSSGTYCQSTPSGINDNSAFTEIQNDLSHHRLQVSCWCQSCSKSRTSSLNTTRNILKPPIRHTDRLGRQFVITLLTVSACFLILNIPYLIVWICRWLEDSMEIYNEFHGAVQSDYKYDPVTEMNVTVGQRDRDNNEDDVTQLYMSIVHSLLNEMRNSTFDNFSQNHLDKRKLNVINYSSYSYETSWIAISLPISRTVFSFNYCINFFLYSLVGKYFRRELRRIFSNWTHLIYARFCPARAKKINRVKQPLQNVKHYNYRFRMEGRSPQNYGANISTSQRDCDCNRSYGSGQVQHV